MKNEKRYAIRCAENGDVIDWFDTIEEAKAALKDYVQQDVADDENETEESAEAFYEVYDLAKEEPIWNY